MKRIGCIAVCLLAVAGGLAPSLAVAQKDPDLRNIIPYLMLVIDTSGSMERKTVCPCLTPACTECLPDCSLSNSTTDLPNKKNRWATTLEALTGTFVNFQCDPLARTVTNGMTYDLNYYLPYHQPWKCTTAGTACPHPTTNFQNVDGIIDLYSGSVQFGLMTFDGWDTYVGATVLVPETNPLDPSSFNVTISNSVQGLWSYAGPQTFHYPNCTNTYMMDTGARSATATEGGLVSLNSCSGVGPPGTNGCENWCSQCGSNTSQQSLNDDIQTALLKSRAYGGTPIAASLDDLYFHLKNLTDNFGSCRNRFALLMTDGYPDDDYRSFRCNCVHDELTSDPDYCAKDPLALTEPDKIHCPYPLPEEEAKDLIQGHGLGSGSQRPARAGDSAMIEQLFVVGLAVDDANVITRLDRIAHAGCPTVGGCDTDGDGHEALFANDLPKLVQNLSAVIDGTLKPVSRSVPAFATTASSTAAQQFTATPNLVQQYQVNTGFQVASQPGTPWTGVIERQRFTCDSAKNPPLIPQDLTSGDRFQDVLNAQNPNTRQLKTALVSNPSVDLDGPLYFGASGDPCGPANDCLSVELTNPGVLPARFGLGPTDTAGKTNITNWMYGINGTVRANKKLGDIYHSSPVIVGPPRFDTSDETFNLFRQRTEIATRPLTLFVGSNDGILHAFVVDDRPTPAPPQGQEMWGFVPPMYINNLATNLNTHQFTVDGTPIVKNVYFNKQGGVDAASVSVANGYHTVLIVGMRGGVGSASNPNGNGYIALDVSDTKFPIFLWQFTDPHMGQAFAQAAVGQATFIDRSSGSNVIKQGAVAILPGGVGQIGPSGLPNDCTNSQSSAMVDQSTSAPFKTFLDVPTSALPVPGTYSHRADVRCWKDIGRSLYFVDVQNGRLIKKIHARSNGSLVFPSPLVSTPALFENDIGTIASRAFITDADGVIWRVDLSAPDQDDDGTHNRPLTGWTARPFHDIFWGTDPVAGELSYEAPLMSVDANGKLVVIVGTGDNNNFTKTTVNNRVVSLTEIIDPTRTPSGVPEDYKAAVNWELRSKPTDGLNLVPSELVTGSMGLFNGQLYFGTFIAITSGNACSVGRGRVHAVDYLARDPTDTNPTPTTHGPLHILPSALGLDAEGQTVVNVTSDNALDNFMVLGLGITERPSCEVVDTADFNVWGQSTFGVKNASAPSIYLVAQASGNTGTGSLIQKRSKSVLGSVQIKVNKRTSPSRVTSWATSVD